MTGCTCTHSGSFVVAYDTGCPRHAAELLNYPRATHGDRVIVPDPDALNGVRYVSVAKREP